MRIFFLPQIDYSTKERIGVAPLVLSVGKQNNEGINRSGYHPCIRLSPNTLYKQYMITSTVQLPWLQFPRHANS